jgi:hypothetical protein
MSTQKQRRDHKAFERRYNATLLPCAHCGGKAILVQWRDTLEPNATWVACQNPDCKMMTEAYHSEYYLAFTQAADRARAVWNKRAKIAPEGPAAQASIGTGAPRVKKLTAGKVSGVPALKTWSFVEHTESDGTRVKVYGPTGGPNDTV